MVQGRAIRVVASAAMLTGVDHVTVAVREIERAVEAYERLLGVPPSWRGTHPALGTEGALFGLSNAALELVAPKGDAEESEGLRARLAGQGEGLVTLAFSISDAGGWSKALREGGLRATPPEEGEALGRGGEVRRYRTVEISQRTTRGIGILGVERPDPDSLRATSPVPAPCVDALDHVVVRTADADAALALYGNGLGLRLALDRTFGSARMLFFRTGKVTIEVVQEAAAGDRDALYGVALRVRDIDAAHARLQAAGVETSELRAGRKLGTHVFTVKSGTCGVPTLFLRDPARD
jgi:catechol 2,3-dioxygenase-like lactoylglutathione lyase family enzyme